MFHKTILPNKLRILAAPMRGTNTVTILVLCATGSDNEPRGKGGISHFLEHMFFKGTRKRPTPQTIMQETVSMGAISNAFTSHEITGYYIKSGNVYLDRSIDLLADIYQNSIFDPREIEREKHVIVEELQKDRDTPTMYVYWLWEELLYGRHQHAGRDVIGMEKDIRSLARSDFIRYFTHQYSAPNTIIIVAGNFDEARTVERLKHLFGDIRRYTPRPKGAFHEAQRFPAVKVHFKETDQTHLMLGFRTVPIGHRARFILDVMEDFIGGNWSSRMFDAVRERGGLAYTVYSNSQLYANRGYFTTYAGVSHGNVEKAIRVILEEYKKVCDKRIGERELRRAKEHMKGTSLIALESSNAVADFIGFQEAMTSRPMTIKEIFAKIESVTPAEIQAAARKFFRPERMNLALIGPLKNESKFAKLLKI